jgi:Tol biopolymer transport system component
VRLGEGHLASLAPDGRSVASILLGERPTLELLPIGAGEPKLIDHGPIVDYLSIAWFPDGNRVLFAGKEAGGGVRAYVQDTRQGPPAAISEAGVRPIRYSDPISPDGSRIIMFDSNERMVETTAAAGAPRPVQGVEAGDMPIRWDASGRSLFLYHRGGLPVRVYRLDMTTGQKEQIAELYPSDPAGVRNIATVQTTADAKYFAYSYSQALSDLYLVEQFR